VGGLGIAHSDASLIAAKIRERRVDDGSPLAASDIPIAAVAAT
jgi:hypothetical protein